MAKRRIVEIQPPIGGIVSSLNYQKQPPYSCNDALNVMSFDPNEERGRVGSRPALVLAYNTADTLGLGGPVTLVDTVRYVDTVTDQVKTKVVAVADGKFWSAVEGGDLAAVGSVKVGHMVTMRGTSYKGKYYLADHGPAFSGTTGNFSDSTTFTDGSIDFETTYGITDAMSLEIISGTGVTQEVITIASISGVTITLDSAATAGLASNDVVYRIWSNATRTIKVYDPSADTFAAVSKSGTTNPPVDAKSICTYYDRLVTEKGREWYMSHMGSATDWDADSNAYDVERAASGANTQAGLIPFPCKAMVAHGDSCCLFFTGTEIHIMRGNPAAGGRIDTVDDTHGCVGNTAVCAAPGGHYFLSKNGLCSIPLGCNARPKNISRPILPQDMIEIDADFLDGRHVTMEYSLDLDTVFVMLSPRVASAATEHWIYQPNFNAFWKWTWPTTGYQPHSMTKLKVEGSGRQEILLGCNDGKVYRLDLDQEKDVATGFASFVDIGPIRIGQGFFRGEIAQISAVVSEDTTDDVSWEVSTGESAEEAAKQATASRIQSGTWTSGKNANSYMVGYGESAMIKVSGDATNDNPAWALSSIVMVVSQEGEQLL